MTGVTVRPDVAADVVAHGWTAACGDSLPRSVVDAAMARWHDHDGVTARVAGDGAFFVADDGSSTMSTVRRPTTIPTRQSSE